MAALPWTRLTSRPFHRRPQRNLPRSFLHPAAASGATAPLVRVAARSFYFPIVLLVMCNDACVKAPCEHRVCSRPAGFRL